MTEPIQSDLIRGQIDTMLLRILVEKDSYGYEMIKDLKERSGGLFTLKEPSLYTSLKRLEKQGFIVSYWGEESQGGRRKYYHITPEGVEAFFQALRQWKEGKALLEVLLEGGLSHGPTAKGTGAHL